MFDSVGEVRGLMSKFLRSRISTKSYDDDSEGFSIHISSEVVDSFADKFCEDCGDWSDLRADSRVLKISRSGQIGYSKLP